MTPPPPRGWTARFARLAPAVASPEPLEAGRAWLMLLANAVGLVAAAFVFAVAPRDHRVTGMIVGAGLTALAAGALVLLHRRSALANHVSVMAAFWMLSAAMFARGGLAAPAAGAMATATVVATFLLGWRAGALWSALVGVELGVYAVLPLFGVVLPDLLEPRFHHAMRILTPLVSVGLVAGVMIAYDRVRNAAEAAREAVERDRVRAETEARLLRTDRMAALGQLASGVAHEINSPLSYVIANLDYVERHLRAAAEDGASDDDLRAAIADVREGAMRVKGIVADLRTFARAGDEDVTGPVDVAEVIDAALKMAGGEIRHRAMLVLDQADVPAVAGNEGRLVQVLLNLLGNAAQAIPEGSTGPHEVRITTRRSADDAVVVEIKDTGSGIAPGDLAKVFTPFFTTKPPGLGTGLGLSVSRRIVRSFGGELTLESSEGVGTTARIVLPAATGARTAAAPPGRPSLPAIEAPRRVLVIDDDAAVRKALARTLRGHEVVCAASGQEALERLRDESPFEVILCDVMMPGMSGVDLLADVRARDPGLAQRFVLVTGGGLTDRVRQLIDEAGSAVIDKPFDPRALRQLVRDAPPLPGAALEDG